MATAITNEVAKNYRFTLSIDMRSNTQEFINEFASTLKASVPHLPLKVEATMVFSGTYSDINKVIRCFPSHDIEELFKRNFAICVNGVVLEQHWNGKYLDKSFSDVVKQIEKSRTAFDNARKN